MEVTISLCNLQLVRKKAIPDKIGEVLASATHYIKRSGRAKELKIWGSFLRTYTKYCKESKSKSGLRLC